MRGRPLAPPGIPSARPARVTFWHWIHRRFAVTGRITAYGCHTCHQYVLGGRRAPDRPPARHISRAQSISTRRQMTSLQGIQAYNNAEPLLSDESDEEQDGQQVYSPCCRNGLFIAKRSWLVHLEGTFLSGVSLRPSPYMWDHSWVFVLESGTHRKRWNQCQTSAAETSTRSPPQEMRAATR